MTDREYRAVCTLIESECGIVFAAGKRTMVEGRLRRRARVLGIESLSTYCQYLLSPEGTLNERPYLVDAVTTHKTDFFREPAHFDYLKAYAVPELIRTTGAGHRRPLLVWSSACSTGEEPYTIAMVLSEQSESLQFRVLGSDISLAVLETARVAVYPEEVARPLPREFHRYLLRSRDRSRSTVRIAPEIRTAVQFQQVNLMDTSYGFEQPFDIVFCRNVMIYFDRSTQAQVLTRIANVLRPGGYLFMGHSESLCGLDLPLSQVAATVYRRSHV